MDTPTDDTMNPTPAAPADDAATPAAMPETPAMPGEEAPAAMPETPAMPGEEAPAAMPETPAMPGEAAPAEEDAPDQAGDGMGGM